METSTEEFFANLRLDTSWYYAWGIFHVAMIIIGAYISNWYYWRVTGNSWFITQFPLIEYTKVTADDTTPVQVARFTGYEPKPQLQITAGTELDVLTLRLCISGRRRPTGSSYGTASDSLFGCWTRLLANMDNKFTSTSFTSPNSTCWSSHWESSPSIFGLWAPMVPAFRHCSLGPAKSAP